MKTILDDRQVFFVKRERHSDLYFITSLNGSGYYIPGDLAGNPGTILGSYHSIDFIDHGINKDWEFRESIKSRTERISYSTFTNYLPLDYKIAIKILEAIK